MIVLCIIFPMVYEQFSYGEYSIYMRMMAVFPLFGMMPFIVAWFVHKKTFHPVVRTLWHCGIMVLVHGFLIKGIIMISGRFTEYEQIYLILGGSLLLMSILTSCLANHRNPSD